MEVLDELRLKNGISLTLIDHSRRVAGDRWLVKVECALLMPADEGFFADLSESDPDLLAEIRRKMAGELRFSLNRERNFIAEADKEQIRAGMLEQLRTNIFDYLATPEFPARLFSRRYGELRQACLIARRQCQSESFAEEDQGPADFSACFRDGTV